MESHFLKDLVIILALSSAVVFLCSRVKLPLVVGLLLTGAVGGPYGLGLIRAVEQVNSLADIGVIFLLFTIGLEFSLRKLWEIRRATFLGGSLQIVFTSVISTGLLTGMGWPLTKAIFLGWLIAPSATAIVLKLLQEKGEIDTPHGQTTLGIQLFQDLAVVPMFFFLPVLAGQAGSGWTPVGWVLLKAIFLLVVLSAAARWFIPALLYHVVRTRSREFFLLFIGLLCLGIAWLTSLLGLSLAMGAFLAGLVVSESEYSRKTLSDILPLRDLFSSFFFLSIGMLVNLNQLVGSVERIALLTIGVLALKSFVGALVTLALRFPVRVAIFVGFAISQLAEVSFILSKSGLAAGLIQQETYEIFLAVCVLTMGLTPFLLNVPSWLSQFTPALSSPVLRRADKISSIPGEPPTAERNNHLIIVGFGTNGRNLAKAARQLGIPYVVIELNPETVRREKTEPILFGDATHEPILRFAGVVEARVLVVAINDAASTQRIVELARRLHPSLYIIARTRFIREVPILKQLGATDVIPEEFETSLEIFTRVLRKYLIPQQDIERFLTEFRTDAYAMLRQPAPGDGTLADLLSTLPEVEITAIRVEQGSQGTGKTLAELRLRQQFGISVVAIRRDQELMVNPPSQTEIREDDVLLLLGDANQIRTACQVLWFRKGTEQSNEGSRL